MNGIRQDQPDHLLATGAARRAASAPGTVVLCFTNTSAAPAAAYLGVWLVGTLESGSYRLAASLAAG